MRRFAIPVLFNMIVPGSGLVVLGRPWLGLFVAASFLAGAELVILGAVVMPARLPVSLSMIALAWAAVAWICGQVLLLARIRLLTSRELPRQLAILQRLAQRSLGRHDYASAKAAIALALSLDDADVASNVLRARWLEAVGRTGRARRAWARVQRLDTDRHQVEGTARNPGIGRAK